MSEYDNENEEALNKRVIWNSYIDGAKKELRNSEENYWRKKKDVVVKLAKDLEDQGMPLPMIAHTIVDALTHDCNISEKHILESLDQKYKREYKRKPKTEVSSEVDDKKVLEEEKQNVESDAKKVLAHYGDGTTVIDKEDIDNPEKQIFKEMDINRGNGQQLQHEDTNERIRQLERQNAELHGKLNAEIKMTRSLTEDLKNAQIPKKTTQFSVFYMPRSMFDQNQKAMYSARKYLVFHAENHQVDEILNESSGKQLLIDAGIEVAE